MIARLITNDIASFAAHTNLDIAAGGVNDVLAERIGLDMATLTPLDVTMKHDLVKLAVYVPVDHADAVRDAICRVDAGHIGNYDSCLSFSEVMSTWRPLKGTDPYIGSIGELSLEPELKVEVTIRAENLEKTLSAIREVHPYEEPVINVLPLLSTGIMNQV